MKERAARGGPEETSPSHKLIAHAPYGLDSNAGSSDLFAQASHVHVDRTRVANIIVSPHEVDQSLPIEHHTRITRQREEQIELLRTQVDRRAIDPNFAAVGVDLHVVQVD